MASTTSTTPSLKTLDPTQGHAFKSPVKCINDGDDVTFFQGSKAYADIMTFLFQLNTSMVPRRRKNEDQGTESTKEWTLQDPDVPHPPVVQSLANLLDTLSACIDEAPPDTGPRRFGNVSFRKWHEIVQERVPALLTKHLPAEVLAFKSTSGVPVTSELEAYLMGSFGSAQRLDYGTGHELSFLAFLGCLWKLGAFPTSHDGDQERGIVLGVIEPYLVLIRRLILTYTLEPAGSHGVWGLDDHSFLPYIFGSAQFSPQISNVSEVATEGSLANAPNPADVAKLSAVERERGRNMYFSAVGFIYDVKKGPFWEHSPILYDVSGVKAGWAKINKGMIKMYNVEVLSKFPVVQHFPFGSLFAWERDPAAKEIQASVHTSSQPKSSSMTTSAPTSRQPAMRDPLAAPAQAPRDPMAAGGPGGMPMTAAPWATARAGAPIPPRDPLSGSGPAGMPMTAAPWAAARTGVPASTATGPMETTRAPWAKPREGAGGSSARGGPGPNR